MEVITRVAVCHHRNQALRLGLWTAIIITLPATVLAQRLQFKTYTTTDGLARDHINRFVPDSRAFLWFCTPKGLSRFDGYDFLNYGAAEGLQGSVRDLLEAHDGIYWIATASGLYRFDPGYPANPRILNMEPGYMIRYPARMPSARQFVSCYASKALHATATRERPALMTSSLHRKFSTSVMARPPCSYLISSNSPACGAMGFSI